GVGVIDDFEIAPDANDGGEISQRRAAALAVEDGEMVGAEPFLLIAVEIARGRIADLAAGLNERLVDGIAWRSARDTKRAAHAVPRICAVVVILRALEIGQHVRIAPTREAHLAPFIVI